MSDFGSGWSQFLGRTDAEWAALKEAERLRPGPTLEEVELQRKQDAARHSHKEMRIEAFAIEWRTLDGKPLDQAASHTNPQGGPSAAMSVALLNETLQGRRLIIPHPVTGEPIGSISLTFGEYRIQSGITY